MILVQWLALNVQLDTTVLRMELVKMKCNLVIFVLLVHIVQQKLVNSQIRSVMLVHLDNIAQVVPQFQLIAQQDLTILILDSSVGKIA